MLTGSTGIATRIDEILAGLDDTPVEEHVAVYVAAHQLLADALAATEPTW